MNEQKMKNWEYSCSQEVMAQIILNKLKKEGRIGRKKEKEIQRKINKLGYSNLLNSPHLEGKEELKRKALLLCFKDYCIKLGEEVLK